MNNIDRAKEIKDLQESIRKLEENIASDNKTLKAKRQTLSDLKDNLVREVLRDE